MEQFFTMNQVTLVLIYSGSSQLPQYIEESLDIASRVAINSRIIFLANKSNYQNFIQFTSRHSLGVRAKIEFIAIEDIPASDRTLLFNEKTGLDKNFRQGFWYQASNRFMVLADYLNHTNTSNVVHIENDYVLYFDPSDKIKAFEEFADFAVPMDRIRAIPGIVWFKNPIVADKLAQFMLMNADQDDMANLGGFCLSSTEINAKPLPTIPLKYAQMKSLNDCKYSQGINLFEGIFDAAAIGQYIGGIHWMNNPEDTTLFQNESSDLLLNDFSFCWVIKNGIRSPKITILDESVRVLGIHAHSKNLLGLSPFNHGIQSDLSTLITGEKIQGCCEITIGTRSITKFHGRENIKSKELIEIEEDVNGNLYAPSTEVIERVSKAKTIFVYTHLIPYFKYYFAPRINTFFNLVTHNSDHSITINDFQLLNSPFLLNWFAQNSEFNHNKLRGIPIGLQNRQWGVDKLDQLISVSRFIEKSESIYVNFSQSTHPARREALDIARDLPNVTIEQEVDYRQYLSSLAKHKFCLCPRGNGIDTHRFWEAQYLDCIPIILWRDWTASFSGMPILILDNWAELKKLDFKKAYIHITTKYYTRAGLNFEEIRDQINK